MKKYLSLTILIFLFLIINAVHGQESSVGSTFEVSTKVYGTPLPPTPTSTVSTSVSGSSILTIKNLNASTTLDSSVISFNTNHATQAKVFWGLTGNYELGSISGLFYGFDHSIKISGLKSDTKYYYKVEVINGLGVVVSAESSFQTLKDFTFIPLANVTHFQAIPQEDSIALLWKIPKNKDISSVRIVKSDKFYPRDINDGEIIFEGNSEEYLDTNVVKGKLYYYALFAKNTKNEYSSGVLAQAKIPLAGEILIPATSTDPFIGISIVENLDSVIRDLTFSDFDFVQDGVKIENTDSIVTIDGKKDLTIILDYDKVPEILKTIAITLIDPEDSSKVFTFLLRVNNEKTKYEATIAPLGRSGKFKVNIIVLDYKNQGLKRIYGLIKAMVFKISDQNVFRNCGIFDEYGNCDDSNNNKNIFVILIIILIIIILLLVSRRRENKKESKEIHEE